MLCVIAKLNGEAAGKLTTVLATVSVPEKALYGHITLATYMGEDEQGFIRFCKNALKDIPSFSVVYDRIKVLKETSVIVAVPQMSGPLNEMNRRISERFASELDEWTKPDRWYPHTTLLYDPKTDLKAICEIMRERFVPLTARIDRIEFSRVEEQGYQIIDHTDLVPTRGRS